MQVCRNCTKREVGCHSYCKAYREEKEEHLKKTAELKQKREETSDVIYRLYGGTKWHR